MSFATDCRLSRVQPFVILWIVVHQAPLSMGSFRQEYWNGLPFPIPGDLPNTGIKPVSLALAGDSSPLWGTWEACISVCIISNHKLLLLCRARTLYRGPNEKTYSLNRTGPEPLLAKPLASIPNSLFLINLLIHRGKKTIKWQALPLPMEPSLKHSLLLSSSVQLFVTPWSAAHQASLSFTISRSFLKLMSIESVMPSNHLILSSPSLIIIIIVIINTNQLKTVSIVQFQCLCDGTVSGFNKQCPESSDNTAKVHWPS